jgi:hypothetical protein
MVALSVAGSVISFAPAAVLGPEAVLTTSAFPDEEPESELESELELPQAARTNADARTASAKTPVRQERLEIQVTTLSFGWAAPKWPPLSFPSSGTQKRSPAGETV